MTTGQNRRRDFELVRGLLHELRQPLTAVSGAISLLEMNFGEQVRNHRDWQLLGEQVARLAHTMTAFDELSSVEGAEKTTFSVGDVIELAVGQIRRSRQVRHEALAVELGAASHLVSGSPRALSLALNNLLSNAWDAVRDMPQGQIGVRVVSANGRVDLRVADNGHGIAPEMRDQLFLPGRSTKSGATPHGLGLFISRQLIERWGGELMLVTEEDPDRSTWAVTEFRISLAAEKAADRAGAAEAPEKDKSVPRALQGLVLAVDDEPAILYLYEKIVGSMGLEVVTAQNGTEALEIVSRRKPALILLDKNLPGMDGVEIAQRVRNLDPHVAIVMISGYPSADAVAALLPLNIHGFLEKPFSHDALTALVQRALRTPAPARPSTGATVRKVTVIDRDPDICSEVSSILSELGLVVTCFDNVVEALSQCPDADAALVAEAEIGNEGVRERLWSRGFSRTDALVIGLLVDHEGLGANVRAVLAGARGTMPRRMLKDRAAARQRLMHLFVPNVAPAAGG